MNRRVGWTVGLLLLAVAGVTATIGLLHPGFGWHETLSAPATAAQAQASPPLVTPGYRTEQEWIVWDITRSLAQISALSRNEPILAGDEIRVSTDPTPAAAAGGSRPAEPRFTIRIAGRAPLH